MSSMILPYFYVLSEPSLFSAIVLGFATHSSYIYPASENY